MDFSRFSGHDLIQPIMFLDVLISRLPLKIEEENPPVVLWRIFGMVGVV
jgi:hypothetical protein